MTNQTGAETMQARAEQLVDEWLSSHWTPTEREIHFEDTRHSLCDAIERELLAVQAEERQRYRALVEKWRAEAAEEQRVSFCAERAGQPRGETARFSQVARGATCES